MAMIQKLCILGKVALGATLLCAWLQANLDTTTGPNLNQALVLASTHTFTNFELARGKVQFRHGFTVPNDTTATIDVHDEVSGTLTINGTLNLAGDIFLGEGASIVTGGNQSTINLNGYTIFLQDDLTLTQSLNLFAVPSGTISGNNHRLVLPSSSPLNLSTPNAAIKFKNITIQNCQENNVLAQGDSVSVILDNVTLQLALGQQFLLTTGNITIYRDVTCSLNKNAAITFDLTGSGQLFINSGGNFYIGPGILFTYQGNEDIGFQDHSSFMHFSNSSFSYDSTNTTAGLANGTLIIEGFVTMSTLNPGGIQIGNGIPAQDLNVYILPGATLDVAGTTTLILANHV